MTGSAQRDPEPNQSIPSIPGVPGANSKLNDYYGGINKCYSWITTSVPGKYVSKIGQLQPDCYISSNFIFAYCMAMLLKPTPDGKVSSPERR